MCSYCVKFPWQVLCDNSTVVNDDDDDDDILSFVMLPELTIKSKFFKFFNVNSSCDGDDDDDGALVMNVCSELCV